MSSKPHSFLFITWDGPSTSYLEGLFLPIFAKLRSAGFSPHVLQFSWGPQSVHKRRALLCEAAGIPYRHVSVWRRLGGAGAFLTAFFGARHIRRAVSDWQIDTLMPRGIMPAIATLLLCQKSRPCVLFDADGLPADERVDFGGLSSSSLTYRLLRDAEAQMVRAAEGVLVRSKAAAYILEARAGAGTDIRKFTVVTNGRDPTPFDRAIADRTATPDRQPGELKLCYVGSVGQQYCPELMIRVAAALRVHYPLLQLRIITGDEANFEKALQGTCIADRSWISSGRLAVEKVPEALASADIGLAFRKPAFSTRAVAPIKLGEYLLSGIPIIGSSQGGDTNKLIAEDVLMSTDGSDLDAVVNWIESVISRRQFFSEKCRALGKELFSLDDSAQRYITALAKLPVRVQTKA